MPIKLYNYNYAEVGIQTTLYNHQKYENVYIYIQMCGNGMHIDVCTHRRISNQKDVLNLYCYWFLLEQTISAQKKPMVISAPLGFSFIGSPFPGAGV